MIPKIIHYCWFGGKEKPQKIANFVKSFDKLKKDGYQIIEWNENNFDVYRNSYLSKAYNNKKWAHVSDFVRLDVLENYGGIYLDTDVEIVKNFDSLLYLDLFIGFMWDCNLGTAVIGASKGNEHIKAMKNFYLQGEISFNSPNNDLLTRYFLDKFDDFKLNGKEQVLDERIKIFEKNVFEHPSLFKSKNYTIHHFTQSWKSNGKIKTIIKRIVVSVIGLYFYRKYICRKSLSVSPFFSKYKQDINSK
ncbi:glycosyltransferase family 32 protein [Brenneria izbisi]|uniref:Glycosyl transferase n=1 Tax=Brenneria izbisi TaxID=2939450 RepID=A0AA41XU21_9GAMM|nr:glycosyltransferase [Brenneria izbisi]MCV9878013.1 hypothetical protein [Brenneria izbisi]MCV9881423.1 hypothetical protein [Brenneria izbisi]